MVNRGGLMLIFDAGQRRGPSGSLPAFIAALAIGFLEFSPTPAHAAGTVVRVGQVAGVIPGDSVQIPITLEAAESGRPLVGFDLFLTFAHGLRLNNVQPGQLLQNCG